MDEFVELINKFKNINQEEKDWTKMKADAKKDFEKAFDEAKDHIILIVDDKILRLGSKSDVAIALAGTIRQEMQDDEDMEYLLKKAIITAFEE